MAPISKTLLAASRRAKTTEERNQQWNDLTNWNQVAQHEVEARAQNVAADEDAVFVATTAHDADVALVRTSTTIGAAGHAHRQFLFRQAETGELAFQLRE